MKDTWQKLSEANPQLNILPISGREFARYGKVLTQYDPTEMIARARALLRQMEGVIYEASVPALEEPSTLNTRIEHEVYGEMPIQVGWCYGRNSHMGALEFHKGTEVDVCITDVVLLVGHVEDIQDGEEIRYDTQRVAAFYAPEGSVIELPAWNLHYAPIHAHADRGFATLVYLPRGTNEPLTHMVEPVGEARLLFAVNKWLLAHSEASELLAEGAYPGLVGEDIIVRPI